MFARSSFYTILSRCVTCLPETSLACESKAFPFPRTLGSQARPGRKSKDHTRDLVVSAMEWTNVRSAETKRTRVKLRTTLTKRVILKIPCWFHAGTEGKNNTPSLYSSFCNRKPGRNRSYSSKEVVLASARPRGS